MNDAREYTERILFQRLLIRLTYKLSAIREWRARLLRELPSHRRRRLDEELKGLERILDRLVAHMNPYKHTFVRVWIGQNRALLSQAVLARSMRMNRSQMRLAFAQGRTKRMTNQLRYLTLNANTFYAKVHKEARLKIYDIFQQLHRKFTFYIVSSVTQEKLIPKPKSAVSHYSSLESKQTEKPIVKTENKKTSASLPKKQNIVRESALSSNVALEPPAVEKQKSAPTTKRVKRKRKLALPKSIRIAKRENQETVARTARKKKIQTIQEKKRWTIPAETIRKPAMKARKEEATNSERVKNQLKSKRTSDIPAIVSVDQSNIPKANKTKRANPTKKKRPIEIEMTPKELTQDSNQIVEDANEEIYVESLDVELDLDSLFQEKKRRQKKKNRSSRYADDLTLI